LGFGSAVEVLEPLELRAELQREAEKLSERYKKLPIRRFSWLANRVTKGTLARGKK
jgi:hypothetical protein